MCIDFPSQVHSHPLFAKQSHRIMLNQCLFLGLAPRNNWYISQSILDVSSQIQSSIIHPNCHFQNSTAITCQFNIHHGLLGTKRILFLSSSSSSNFSFFFFLSLSPSFSLSLSLHLSLFLSLSSPSFSFFFILYPQM